MTTETETENTATQDQADAEAAFSASFEGKEVPPAPKPAEKTDAEKAAEAAAQAQASASAASSAAPATPEGKAGVTEAASATPAAPATPEAASTPTPSPKADEVAELRAELRKVHGRMGALNDELTKLKTGKEAEGKPAAATPLELARLKAEYPELADVLTEDLGKAIGGLAAKGSDPKEVEELVSQRVQDGIAKAAAKLRDDAVSDAHPTWRSDLFTEDPATGQKKPTADYLAWRTAIGADEAKAFEGSDNPYFVVRKLTSFYEWRAKAAKAQAEKQQRLAAAVPATQGAPRAASTNLSDDEAMQKGFLEGFNS